MLITIAAIIDMIVLFGTFGPAIYFSLGLLTLDSISDIPRYIENETDYAICAAVFYVFLAINFFAYVQLSRG